MWEWTGRCSVGWPAHTNLRMKMDEGAEGVRCQCLDKHLPFCDTCVLILRGGPHPGCPTRKWGWHRWEGTNWHRTRHFQNGGGNSMSDVVPPWFLPERGSKLPRRPQVCRWENPTFWSRAWMTWMKYCNERRKSSLGADDSVPVACVGPGKQPGGGLPLSDGTSDQLARVHSAFRHHHASAP